MLVLIYLLSSYMCVFFSTSSFNSDQRWYRTSLGLLRDSLQSFQVNGCAISQSKRLDWDVSNLICCFLVLSSPLKYSQYNTYSSLSLVRWVSIFMFIGAFIDLNRVIVLCTRFTDEIFSFLISLIFIINAIGSPFSDVGVVHYFDFNHKSHGPYDDDPYYSHWASALLSVIIFVGTTQGT